MDEAQSPKDRLIKAGEFASRVGVETLTIWRWKQQKKIPFVQLNGGRSIRFRESDAEQIIKTGSAIE